MNPQLRMCGLVIPTLLTEKQKRRNNALCVAHPIVDFWANSTWGMRARVPRPGHARCHNLWDDMLALGI